jgi:hypothetical protein
MSTHKGHKENEFSTKMIVVLTILVKLFRGQVPLSYTSGSVNGILAHPKYHTRVFIITLCQVIYTAEQLPLFLISVCRSG